MRAAIYCRVSTDRQESEGSSLKTQLDRCRAFCATHGWTVVREEQETASGGDLAGRPKLRGIVDAIQAGQVDVLVVFAVDRLSRDQSAQGWLFYEIEQRAGGRIESVSEDLNGVTGTVLRAVSGLLAQLEKEKIRERFSRGMAHRVRDEGRPTGTGANPFGLSWVNGTDPRTGKVIPKVRYEPDPVTAPVVRGLFEQYDRGASLRDLCRWLQAQGVPPPRGRSERWQPTSVRGLLQYRGYTGVGEGFKTRERRTREPGKGIVVRVEHVPREERVRLTEGTYPVVVDPALFQRVQARLAVAQAESQRPDRDPQTAVLRRGVAVCGLCGARLMVKSSGHQKQLYACPRTRQRIGPCPAPHCIVAQTLDEQVLNAVGWFVGEVDRLDRVTPRDRATGSDAGAAAVARLDQEAEAVDRRIGNLRRAVAEEDDPALGAMLRDDLKSAIAERAAVADQLAALADHRAQAEADRAKLAAAVAQVRSVDGRIDEMSFEERRYLLRQLNVRVYVFPKGSDWGRWIATMSLGAGGGEDRRLATAQGWQDPDTGEWATDCIARWDRSAAIRAGNGGKVLSGVAVTIPTRIRPQGSDSRNPSRPVVSVAEGVTHEPSTHSTCQSNA